MLTLAQFCTPDDVRALLGVSEEELEDTAIGLPAQMLMVSERLQDLNTSMASTFLALTIPGTANEERFSELIKSFGAYIVAQHLLGSVKMFAPQVVMDSKSQMSRVADPFSDLRGSIQGSLSYIGNRAKVVYALMYPSAVLAAPTTRVFASTVPIAFDPVTNT